MLNPNAMKDIRFPREKTNILLRGGILMRDEIAGSEPTITMKNVAFGKARRILNYSYMEVFHNDVWVMVKSFEEDLLKALYMESSTATNDGKRVETCPNIEAMVEVLKEVATGPVEVVPSLIGEFPVVTVNTEANMTASVTTETEVQNEATSVEVPFTFTSTEEEEEEPATEAEKAEEESENSEEESTTEPPMEEESEENTTEEEAEEHMEAPAEEEKKEEPVPVSNEANTFAATAVRQPIHGKKKHRH